MSEDEIREWFRRRYPQYGDNFELAKILYEKMVKKKGRYNFDFEYKEVKVGEIKEGMRVKIRGIVGDIIKKKYLGCKICKRKECEEHNEGKKEWISITYRVGDETGIVSCVMIVDREGNIEIGDEVILKGLVKSWRGKSEISIDEIQKIMDVKIAEILGNIRASKGMSDKILESLCKQEGVDIEEVKKHLEKNEKGLWVVKENGN